MLFQGVKLDSYSIISDRMNNQTDISEMEGKEEEWRCVSTYTNWQQTSSHSCIWPIIRLSAESDKGDDTDRKRVSRRKRMKYGMYACLIYGIGSSFYRLPLILIMGTHENFISP